MTRTYQYEKIKLNINELSIFRAEQQIVAGLDLTHESTRFLQIVGPNGSGKSTLLAALAGLLPYQGTLLWTAESIDLEEHPITTQMAFVSHLNAIKPELTLTENLTFLANVNDGDVARIPLALDAAGLGTLAHVPAGNMSKGQQRRASIARLLVVDKPIWLLDEPTSALDKQGDRWVAGLISDHLKSNGFCIAATHRQISLDPAIAVTTLEMGGGQDEPEPEGAA